MSSEQQKIKLGPQVSLINEKNDLKKLQTNVDTMKNRVDLLKQQLQKEKDAIKKNKVLMKQAIDKKIQIHKLNRYKQKDSSQEQRKMEQLRQRNQSMRVSHQRELEDIQKAIYLVKVDDAREVKNISNEHKRRLKEMDRQFLSAQKEKKKKVAEESAKAKERYIQYMKQKLTAIYTEQAQTMANIAETKEKKKEELRELEEEEMKLMDEINKYHTKEVQSKKQYLAALSLPVKDVAEAMGEKGQKQKEKVETKRSNRSSFRSSLDLTESHATTVERGGYKLPNTNVNQAKLKVILRELKKIDRSQETYSARNN